MIWVAGQIVADESLSISVLDRTFEHGLGLFETLRTWDGRPTLLSRHLQRLKRSADQLGLAIGPSALPDAVAVRRLIDAGGGLGDRVVRLTLSGGLEPETPGTLWMRTCSLPPPAPEAGVRVRASWEAAVDDPLGAFKTLNYWRRRDLHARALRAGYDEDIGSSPDGRILEGTRTNVFTVIAGTLMTPKSDPGSPTAPCPILPGIMRSLVIERARSLGLATVERADLTLGQLQSADELFLTNSVRGIIPVAELGSRRYDGPGPVTRRLTIDLEAWLRSEDAR